MLLLCMSMIRSIAMNTMFSNYFSCILSWNSLVYAIFKLKSPKLWPLYIILSINVSLSYSSKKYICTINLIQNDPCDFSTLNGLNLPLFKIRSILQFTCMKSGLLETGTVIISWSQPSSSWVKGPQVWLPP